MAVHMVISSLEPPTVTNSLLRTHTHLKENGQPAMQMSGDKSTTAATLLGFIRGHMHQTPLQRPAARTSPSVGSRPTIKSQSLKILLKFLLLVNYLHDFFASSECASQH